ncbi:cation-translocating P-type ATPase [Novosphingobium mangrovi (ex Huang et al. 2023)]|uniref:Cation-transporting P-type ATPase n=1 Tax=Novosphingobium mangrovi (ex Huang et al. 2023) TaxID=2976432 RepID=A0ABT2I1R8_9SPHN|nr:cation-transporting P-type ATPase [Novosphingobium mangrovi (ex Huang et al. 2023)]MCT2398753.1 cation-transporting P-type ATPase [Novosphingobium mangrovi (ex Huang et al. 2023)]
MTVVVHHHVPGRTRLRLDPWPKAASLDAIHDMLSRLGSMVVSANPLSGSMLVRHPVSLSARELHGHVENQAKVAPGKPGADVSTLRAPDGSPRRELDQMAVMDTVGILREFGSAPEGLESDEAKRRLSVHGYNATPAPAGRSPAEMAIEQFTTFPVALLFGSAILSVATGGVIDAAVTLGVVVANAVIGFSSESATESLIRRLSRPVERDGSVMRDGVCVTVPAREIVPGDVIVLAPGDFVPADARLLEAHDLSADESGLTGESLPAQKWAEPLDRPPASVAERSNILHGGTIVTGGNGRALVIGTGSETEMARTRAMIGLARPPRPEIEDQLAWLGKRLSLGCLGASGLVFTIGLMRGEPLLGITKSAIALAVAAIPEGLPAVATSTLALGARAMEKEQTYVRALPAIEALGTIDTICLDKTGTLTENRMRVVGAHVDGRILDLSPGNEWPRADIEMLRPLAKVVSLCNEASLADSTGSATEMALLHFARLVGVDPEELQVRSPILTVRSRNEKQRWMATEHNDGEDLLVAMKGAPDELLALATHELSDGIAVPLSTERRGQILQANEELAAKGLRILGVARRDGDLGTPAPDDLVWLGLVALADPIRAEAREAIETFHRAGIRTIMLTGDQPVTALAVAETLALSRTGIIPVVETSRFVGLDDREVGELALKTSVFARVSPGDKLRIVKGLQAVGKRVAMIGDGINDGPALRAASVGVAMGVGGTDVAREVADIVIADDDLRALARAIARGRATDDNIRTAIRYFLSTNLSEVLVMLGESLHGQGELETPMELFWLNLVTDILPGLGLALAEPRGDVMTRPARAAEAPLFTGDEIGTMVKDGSGIAVAALAAHFIGQMRSGPGPTVRGTTFLTLALAQFAQAWVLRDRSANAGEALIESEHRLEGTLAVAGGLLAAPFVFPSLRSLLGIALPTGGHLALSGTLAGAYFLFAESRRIVSRGSVGADGPSRASRPGRTVSVPDLRPVRARAG